MKTKTFDAVEMKRRGAAQIYELTKHMTREEELKFWQQGTEELKELQRRLQMGEAERSDSASALRPEDANAEAISS